MQVGSQTDTITFDYSNADHRTRLVSFNRTEGHRRTDADHSRQPGRVNANGLTRPMASPAAARPSPLNATDYLGNNVPVTANFPSGTVFPSGLTTVQIAAIDSLGQETVGSFTVTVIPGPPLVTIQAVKNIAASGSNYGISLQWTPMLNVTGYNVKRATSATGTFTNVSTNQSGNTFTDSGLANTGYYYEVTALYNSYEGMPSAVVSLPLTSLGAFTGSGLGTVVGDGAFKSGNSYQPDQLDGRRHRRGERPGDLRVRAVVGRRVVHRAARQHGRAGQFGQRLRFLRRHDAAEHQQQQPDGRVRLWSLRGGNLFLRTQPGGDLRRDHGPVRLHRRARPHLEPTRAFG